MYTIILESDRLKLRSLSYAELVNITSGDMERVPVIIDKEAITEIVKAATLKKLVKMHEIPERTHPWYTYWIIMDKEKESGIGFIGFKGRPNEEGHSEVGYSISSKFRNAGLMTEALQLLIKWAKEDEECKAVTAMRVLRTNIASNRVLQKCGFRMFFESEKEINYILVLSY